MKRQKFNLVINFAFLSVTVLLFVITLFGWYISNREVSASGIGARTSDEKEIVLLDTVTAIRYNLSGDVITDTYSRVNEFDLYLTKRDSLDHETGTHTIETHQVSDQIPFLIYELLPGEYVDITVGYKIKTGHNGSSYKISLNDISGGAFTVDEITHYASGAFKYASVSLKDKTGTDVVTYDDIEYSWFHSYSISATDVLPSKVTILEHTWQDSYEELYYKFRIYEDFTQYYQLIGKASESYGALLSQLNLNIGYIYLMF